MLGRGRWLSFHARALLSLGRSCAIANTLVSGGFVVWLIMLGRGDSLFTRKLCFHSVEAALLPNTLVSEGFLDDREGLGVIWGGFINWGGFRWRFIGSNWARRWVLRIVFLILRAPFQAHPMVICGYFFTFTASPCGIVVQYRLRAVWPGSNPGGCPFVSRGCYTVGFNPYPNAWKKLNTVPFDLPPCAGNASASHSQSACFRLKG